MTLGLLYLNKRKIVRSRRSNSLNCFLVIAFLTILHRVGSPNSVSAVCDLSFVDGNKLYSFSLVSPLPNLPHGVRSEDGFYKDCGGSSRCGMECSALVANNIGGYDVCTTIGRIWSTTTDIIDNQNPHKGVIIKMTSGGLKHNCSLSVYVICDSNRVHGPHSLEKLGTCDYAAVLQHPSGCATVINVHGKGWGWFGTLMIIILCLLGGYLLADDSEPGFLDQATSQNTEFFGIFGLEI